MADRDSWRAKKPPPDLSAFLKMVAGAGIEPATQEFTATTQTLQEATGRAGRREAVVYVRRSNRCGATIGAGNSSLAFLTRERYTTLCSLAVQSATDLKPCISQANANIAVATLSLTMRQSDKQASALIASSRPFCNPRQQNRMYHPRTFRLVSKQTNGSSPSC